MENLNLIQEALKCQAKSWSVIPINPGTKKPYLDTWKEFQNRRATAEEIKKWWKLWPNAAIGVVTGEITGIIVVDVDPRHGGNTDGLTPTVISKTGGGGWHYFYMYQTGLKNGIAIKPGVDVKTDGGYSILPPSLHISGNRYEWVVSPENADLVPLPKWVAELTQKSGDKSWSEVSAGVNEGSRNETAASLAGKLVKHLPETDWSTLAAPLLKAWNSQNQPPLPSAELMSVFDSITQREYQERVSGRNPKDSSLNSLAEGEKVSWPQPMAEAAYYGLAGEVIKTVAPHSEADPTALLANFLTGIGSIIGDKPHFSVEADKHPARLFINLVGKTAKGRKGTSWGYIRKILTQIEPDWDKKTQTGLSSGEGLIWAVRDEITQQQPVKKGGAVVGYQQVIIDAGIKDKRLLVMESEFASTLRVLGRDGNTLSPVIRSGWDSGNLQTLTKNSPAKATGAHISIIGHITLQELLRYLTEVEAANGFGNRFLWFCVQRSKSLPFGSKFDDLDLVPLINKLKEVVEFTTEVTEVSWATETRPIWEDIYPELSEGLPGLVGSMLARAEAYVVRLSLIYALLDKSTLIHPKHLAAALAIWRYCEDSVKYIFQDKTGDSLADEILDELSHSPEGMSRTEISDSLGRHKSSQQIGASLSLLELLGLAESKGASTEGREKEIWFINKNSEKSEISETVELVNSLNSQQLKGKNEKA